MAKPDPVAPVAGKGKQTRAGVDRLTPDLFGDGEKGEGV
jgi:hypothetical protein